MIPIIYNKYIYINTKLIFLIKRRRKGNSNLLYNFNLFYITLNNHIINNINKKNFILFFFFLKNNFKKKKYFYNKNIYIYIF